MSSGTVCLLVAMFLSTSVACAEGVDHVLFDFRGRDTAEGWRLNIYGTNSKGVKRGGSGNMELVSGKHAADKALRFSSKEAGSYNFISPEIPEGTWRNRKYYGAQIRYRGDGSAGRMQIYAVTPDGQYAITLRFDGTKTWKTEIHRSGWSRPGTPPLDWSKITKIYVHGSGTRAVDIEKITLVGGVKRIHLEEQHAPVGLGDLNLGPRSDAKIEVSQTELFKLDQNAPGYNCRLLLEHQKAEGRTVFAELQLTAPGEAARAVAETEIVLGPSPETGVGLAFEYTQTRDGTHLLDLVVRDAEGRPSAIKRFSFLLTRPRQLDYQKVVLWPEPQVWKPGDERWILPETLTLSTTGKGDAFPAEHLAEKLKSRYGVRLVKHDKPASDVRLEYVAGRVIKPDGFVLDVNASGVHLQASSSRGMYYAVRALLDIARQSSFAKPEAGILCAHCEDWPDVPMRVYTDFFISERYHKTPLTVDAFKTHIYDQIAGGRYNLYAMQISEHVRYDTHPELAPRNSFTKPQLKEIIDFARKHYVDVAPGWNTPGHCGWLVQHVHQELQEDGDRKTLCTSNPAGMRILKDIAQELLDLVEPTYFHMGGDEVTHGWNGVAKRTCELCAGKPRNQLLLEHWSELARFFEERGVTPILFDDMLSVRWNGGAPYDCAEILPKLPRNLIIATWGTSPLSVPTEKLRELGFAPWWLSTSFAASKMDSFPNMWKNYDACGISETTVWVWSNFTHADKQCNYSTPALHANAACCWKPAVAGVGRAALIHSDGIHWSNVMQVPDWGARKLSYQPVSITAACNDSTRDVQAGDGQGWMDLGPEQDLRSLPNGSLSVGGIPFGRPKAEKDCIILKQQEVSRPVKVSKTVLGFAFAHTAGADEIQRKALQQRFFRKNTDPLAMPVAYYRVRYEDGTSSSIPVRLGYDVHFWNCEAPARIMPGPSTYWMGETSSQQQESPNAPDACVWVMEWKNPLPDVPVEDVTFMAAGTEATVACLGITAVRSAACR